MRTKMIDAVALAKVYGVRPVDRALATAADLGSFADEDLAQLMRHEATALPGDLRRLDEMRSLQASTSGCAGFGSSVDLHRRRYLRTWRRCCDGCICRTCIEPRRR